MSCTYASNTSATYVLPSNISMGQHTLTGYVVDSLGQSSTPVTWTGTLQAPQVVFNNNGSGSVQLDWTGDNGPVILNGGQSYTINGTAAGLTVTLLTSNADYMLQTNGGIDAINAATGVTAVNLMVDTGINDTSFAMWVGDGHVGNVNLSAGSSVSISARGDLWNLDGPSSNGTLTGVTAGQLEFANLDGSIMGVDSIMFLYASGWLGTSMSQEVEVASGIGKLSAYGVGATVHADLRQDAGDAAMAVTVGDGGVPGVIDGGNVGNVAIAGNVNVFEAGTQEGSFDPIWMNMDVIKKATNPPLSYGGIGKLVFAGKATVASITAGYLGFLEAKQTLTVSAGIVATQIGQVQVDDGDLNIGTNAKNGGSLFSASTIGPISITGHLDQVNMRNYVGGSVYMNGGKIQALGNITSIAVQNRLYARVSSVFGNVGPIDVWNNVKDQNGDEVPTLQSFEGSVSAGGNVGPIRVRGNFYLPAVPLDRYLVYAKGNIGPITVAGDLGQEQNPIGQAYRIQGASIDVIDAQGTTGNGGQILNGNIFLVSIRASNGGIKGILTAQLMQTSVEAVGGDIRAVEAGTIQGNIRAKWSAATNQGGNIWNVRAARGFLPVIGSNPNKEPPSIIADELIGKVVVWGFAGDKIKVIIQAQGGGKFDATTGKASPQALIVDVEKGTFLGKISFIAPAGGSNIPVVLFTMPAPPNSLPLLQLTDSAHAGTVWTLAGPVGQKVSVVYAMFDWNPSDVPAVIKQVGYQKARTKFSAGGWTINGPAQ